MSTLLSFIAHWDLWTWIGFFGQLCFFGRFVVQWIATERNKKIVFPVAFWYCSIFGAAVLFMYSIVRNDIVFMAGFGLSLIIYARNLVIHYRVHNAAFPVKEYSRE